MIYKLIGLLMFLLIPFLFLGYTILFSNRVARQIYLKSKVAFESVFSLFFGMASFKLLTSEIGK